MPTCTCGTDFEAKRADAQFCSPSCRKQANRKPELARLVEAQREHRGYVAGVSLDGKPVKIPGPYVPTPESEQRARQILDLRRNAARVEYPL